ncbi:hypothetical protein HPB48_023522 [Haemaphysalis longicornis]|uniref:CCHC-type domain-containing protein n=1 Tax=Haemaphysalis longicornis TaxID=44386 RepID=A0A9J6H6C2_HAELO|nr:hypothetical protein HPB48_023522 [Haemaphysalis longicornis]
MIVNQRNSKSLEAKRVKTTTTVVVLFDDMKVPNYVMCGVSMLRFTLYTRQTDVCYGCGGLGHKADVCLNPSKKVCRGCGLASPTEDHPRSPKWALCGARTARRTDCANNAFKFRTWFDAEDRAGSAPGRFSNSWPRRAVHVTPAWQVFPGGGAPPRQLAVGAASAGGAPVPGGRSRSRGRIHNGPTWADRTKPKPEGQRHH